MVKQTIKIKQPATKQRLIWRIQEFLKGIEAILVFIVFPMLVYILLWSWNIPIRGLYYVTATIYAITAIVAIMESMVALKRRDATRRAHRLSPVHPTYTIIVPAFLPNEERIIIPIMRNMILVTADAADQVVQIILVYNTPYDMLVENELKELEEKYPKFTAYRVPNSKSKAENLNSAIKMIKGAVTILFDADHMLDPGVLGKAWRWLYNGYDVTQGRNVIRNWDQNFLTKMQAVEFETMYSVSHAARSFICDSTLFGGSNGYWLTSTLRRYQFNPKQMTEDIDISIRVLLDGGKIIHDRSLISSELACDTWKKLWYQRKRWAHGWFQASLTHQLKVIFNKHLSPFQKLYWTYLLIWSQVIYPIGGFQLYPIVFALWITTGKVEINFDWYIAVTALITFISGPIQVYVAYRMQARNLPKRYFFWYSIFGVYYAFFKMILSLVGIRDFIANDRKWVVTKR